jgi:hypothetical protein
LNSLPVPKYTDRPPFVFDNVADEIGRVAQITRTGAWLDLIRQLDAKLRRSFELEVRRLESIRIGSCSDVLRKYSGIEFLCGDFADTVCSATSGDFVFFDPPGNFALTDHKRLAKCFRNLSASGAICVAAIPVAAEVATLYDDFEIQDVLGPAPTPKRKPRKNKVVAVQRPIIAKFVIGQRALVAVRA